MAGAVAVSAAGYRLALRRGRPVLAPRLDVPARRDLDGRLIAGAAIFGLGWGLAASAPARPHHPDGGPTEAVTFVAAMVAGMLLFPPDAAGAIEADGRAGSRGMMPGPLTSGLAAGSGGVVGVILGLAAGRLDPRGPAPDLRGRRVLASRRHRDERPGGLGQRGGQPRPAMAGRDVKWRCAAVFSLAGVLGALVGSAAAKAVDGGA